MDSSEPMEHAGGSHLTTDSLPEIPIPLSTDALPEIPIPLTVSSTRTVSIDLLPPGSVSIPSAAQNVAAAYDGLAAGYDTFHIDTKSQAENEFIASRLARRVHGDGRVLDLGCGTGLLLDLLSISPERYVGIDVSSKMLNLARQKHPAHEFVLADAQQLGPTFGRFDMVVSLFGSPSYCGLPALTKTIDGLRATDGGLFLMYCGPRYVQRATYINKDKSLLKSYDTAALAHAYPQSRIWGMSCAVDLMPRWTPISLMRGLLFVDTLTVGRMASDLCFFLVVER